MESLFEPSSYLDPNPFDSSSFLTFSSFADLTCSTSSPIISDTWDDLFTSASSSSSSSSSSSASSLSSLFPLPPSKTPSSKNKQPPAPPRSTYSAPSDCSTPDLGTYDPFELINSAFEDSYSAGIFHIPSQAGPSKLSAADAVPVPGLTHRVTSSTDSSWDSPLITPALNGPAGINSPKDLSLGAFSWDDAPTTLASSSSSYTPPTVAFSPAPLRVASNPSLGSAKNPRAIKPIASMPSLTEESDSFQWFDGSLLDQSTEPVTDEALVDNFDWVFGDYGLGESLPMEGTIFAAFQESGNHANAMAGTSSNANNTPVTSTSASVPLPSQPTFSTLQNSTSPIETTDNTQNNLNDLSWLNPSTNVSASSMQTFDYSQTFTIDPLVLGGNSDAGSRPASAPKAEAGEGIGMLSAPMAGQMSRSLTAPGFVPNRSAPTSDLFSYDPQPIYSHYQQPQQQHQQQQQPSYAPSQILPMRSLPQRRASHGLTISVRQPSFSTFTQPSDLPPTPQSAPFTSTSMSHMQAQAHSQSYAPQYPSHLGAPVPMTRAGTQPLPMTRRMSSDATSGAAGSRHVSNTGGPPMPAHLIRAQAIVQMQEAKEEQQRQELRRQAASRRVNMAEASVMQPLNPTPTPIMHSHSHSHPHSQPRSQPAIVGWEGPSSLPSQSNMPSGMHSSQQPMVVHPPPSYYGGVQTQTQTQQPPPHQYHPAPQQAPPPPHRVHPPPYPGMGLGISSSGTTVSGRPMARLPSPKTRKVTSPSKRSPSGNKRRGQMQPGGFSWGEATFINFTPDDAEKLLTGVAPSGSQAKRKREEDAARLGMGMGMGVGVGMSMGMAGMAMGQEYLALDMDREGSKRSRTGD